MNHPGPRDSEAGPDSLQMAIAAAKWTGVSLTQGEMDLLTAYRSWLAGEAIPAGGLGPNEGHRLWERHVADSLLFGSGLGEGKLCLDIGSGVGLPGIPLAISHPQAHFDLVDKSGRRCDLLRRAIGVLGLRNCSVIHSDVAQLERTYPFVVSRAAMPADQLLIHVKHLLEQGGIANISVSRTGDWKSGVCPPTGIGLSRISVPHRVLDTGVQLLRIEAIQDGS